MEGVEQGARFCYTRVSLPPKTTMHVEHFEKGIRYSDQDLILLAKKIGKLATYCKRLKDEGSSIRVEAEREDTKKANDRVNVQITVHLPQKVLRAESLKTDALTGVDRCIDKLEPQIKKYKEMHTGKGKVQAAGRRAE